MGIVRVRFRPVSNVTWIAAGRPALHSNAYMSILYSGLFYLAGCGKLCQQWYMSIDEMLGAGFPSCCLEGVPFSHVRVTGFAKELPLPGQRDKRTSMATTVRTKRPHSLTGLAHSLLWPLIVVLFLGWVVEIIGLAGLQHNCSDDTFISSPLFATNTQLPSGLVCSTSALLCLILCFVMLLEFVQHIFVWCRE